MPGESTGEVVNPIRIMIVDAAPIVREGLRTVIAGEPDLVLCGQAASCAEALGLVEATKPDLIIVAVSLTDGSGVWLIERIRSRKSRVRFLVLSHQNEDPFAERALRAGALGFLGKREPTEAIVDAIRRVSRGNLYLSEDIAEQLLQGLVAGPAERSPVESFTDRELQVFDFLRQGLTTRQIAARLKVRCKTVETDRKSIGVKLKIVRSGKPAERAAPRAARSRQEGDSPARGRRRT
jgi:DNA-binding NarL/FixJ family response regulator